MICRLQRNITRSCGYQLPTITEMYFLNYGDLNGYTTDTYDDCEFINSIDYDEQFYKVEGTNVSYTDRLVIDDYQRYRQKTLEFNLYGLDECRVRDYDVLSLGRYVVLLQVEGQWILAGFANGFEADENEISTENDFRIVMTENSIVSSLPVDEAVVESIIHHEQRRVKARLYYTNGREEIVYSNGAADTTLYANEIPADTSSSKLQMVVIDNMVTDIESGIFGGRSELENVIISSGVTAIPNDFCKNCRSLSSVTIPNGVTSIGDLAFSKTKLTSIDLPNGLLTIGDSAFDFTNLKEVRVPASVTSIGDLAFSNSDYMKMIVFTGATAPTIGQDAFDMINDADIFVPCGNESYNQGNWANYETKEEMTFELHAGLLTYTLCGYDYIDYAMVRDFIESGGMQLNNISAITVGDYVKEIREYSFDAEERMNQIKSIEIGKNVELIEDLAFYTQDNIESITIYNETPPIISSLSDLIDTGGTSGDNILIFVPSGSVQTYKEAEGWEDNEEQIFPIGYVQKDYLAFVALEDGIFSFNGNGIQYSLDSGVTWITSATTPTIHSGETVMWKAQLTPSTDGIGIFSSTKSFNVEGNIMSLLYGDNFENQTDLTGKNYAFADLFEGNKIISVQNLSLPATTLEEGCYDNMFRDCTSLVKAPELPALTMAEGCYAQMFQGCTSLVTAPDLPATTLASSCYQSMFAGCTSLETAPDLPALTLVDSCYFEMFEGCASLNYIKAMFTTTPSSSRPYEYTVRWVDGVAATGTFVKNSEATWTTTGVSGVPNGWTIEYA